MKKKFPKNIMKFINKKDSNSTYSTSSNSERMNKKIHLSQNNYIEKNKENNIYNQQQFDPNKNPKIKNIKLTNFINNNHLKDNFIKKTIHLKISEKKNKINNSLDFTFSNNNNSLNNSREMNKKKDLNILQKKNLFGKSYHNIFSSRNLKQNSFDNSYKKNNSKNENIKYEKDSSYTEIIKFIDNLKNFDVKEKALKFLSMPRMLTLLNKEENKNKRFIFLMIKSNVYHKLNIENYEIKFMQPNNREIIQSFNILSIYYCKTIHKKIDNIEIIEISVKNINHDSDNLLYYILSSSIEECKEFVKSINFILDICKCASVQINEKFINKKKEN